MEILGIGPSELILIIIIVLILFSPKDMQKAGKIIGKWLRKIVTSDGWKLFQQTSREIQTLPNRLMREAQLDELKSLDKDIKQDLKQTTDKLQQSGQPSQPASDTSPQTPQPENKILPPPSSDPGGEGKNA